MAEWRWVALAEAVGWRAMQQLRAAGYDARQVWRMPAERLATLPGLDLDRAHRLAELRRTVRLAELAARYRWAGAWFVTDGEPGYPDGLTHLGKFAPPVLFGQGKAAVDWRRAVAVVGTRKPSAYGMSVAFTLGRELAAAGLVVVSGLAIGIDAAAHRGALEAGGLTVAVMGCGLDTTYPRQNAALLATIRRDGLVISEHPLGTPPLPHHFPARNRILAALCLGVVVVEAGDRSGTMSTVDHATSMGRDIMAVPGPITSPVSIGPNRLIADGAALVRNAEDVLSVLQLDAQLPAAQPAIRVEPKLEGDEATLYGCLGTGPADLDELVRRTGLAPASVAAVVGLLEIRGLVVRLPGHRVGRK